MWQQCLRGHSHLAHKQKSAELDTSLRRCAHQCAAAACRRPTLAPSGAPACSGRTGSLLDSTRARHAAPFKGSATAPLDGPEAPRAQKVRDFRETETARRFTQNTTASRGARGRRCTTRQAGVVNEQRLRARGVAGMSGCTSEYVGNAHGVFGFAIGWSID